MPTGVTKEPRNSGSASSTSGRRATKSTSAGRSGPRASVACISCRQKKTKCDAQKKEPGMRCTMCRNSDTECVMIRNDDRRKYGSREHIAALQGRIHSIEALISDYEFPRIGRMPPGQLTDVGSNIIVADGPSNAGDCPHDSSDTIHVVAHGEQTPDSLSGAEDIIITEKNSQDSFPGPTELGTYVFSQEAGEEPTLNNDDDTRTVVDDIVHDSRPHDNGGMRVFPPYLTPEVEDSGPGLGADSSPGQVRYYGPTTNLHIQSPIETRADAMPEIPSFESESVVNMDSPKLRDVLIRSCWYYYSLSVQVVDEQLFTLHRAAGKRSQYYSAFLEHALLACATRISTSAAVRKLGRPYAERAKQEVVFELEQPTIASLQGFLLLSDFEATSARDRVGWIYSGIACRLLFDLGLHQDCSQLVQHGVLSEDDARLRHELFLSSFVYDKLWAMYLGRPACIPPAALDVGRLSTAVVSGAKSATIASWVTLCTRISDVTEELNASGAMNDNGVIDRLSELSLNIIASYESFAPQISSKRCEITELDATSYALNIQFCGIQIVLHRALVKALRTQASQTSEGWDAKVDKSRGVMHDNAVSICRLMLAYREIFGAENIVTIMLDNMFVAGNTIISYLLHPPANASAGDEARLLAFLSDTLLTVQKHYPVAGKMYKTFFSITKDTHLATVFGGEEEIPGTMHDSLKRATGTVWPQNNGSWGSMSALMNDDFLLDNSIVTDPALGDPSWLSHLDIDILQ